MNQTTWKELRLSNARLEKAKADLKNEIEITLAWMAEVEERIKK
jgi:hypothetical protein